MRAKRSIKDSLKRYLNWCVGRLLLGGSRDDTVRDMVDAISDEIASIEGGGGTGKVQDELQIESSTGADPGLVGIDDTGIYLKQGNNGINLKDGKLYLNNVEEFYNSDNLTSLSQLINDLNSIKAGTRVASMEVDLSSIQSYLRYDLFDASTTGTKPSGLTTGFLLTFAWDNGGWGAQLATSDGNLDGAIFLRTVKQTESGKIWGPWVSLYNTANLNLENYIKKDQETGIVTVSDPEVHNGTNTFNGSVILGDGVGISNGGNQLLGKNTEGDLEIGDGTLGIDLKADLVHRVDGDKRYIIWDEDLLPNPIHEIGTTDDLNQATSRGTYSFGAGTLNVPTNISGYGWVLVMINQSNPLYKTQICGGFKSSGEYCGLYTRYFDPETGIWSSWVNILDLNNFNPAEYLKLAGGMMTGNLVLADGVKVSNTEGQNIAAFMAFASTVKRMVYGNINVPTLLLSNGPLKRRTAEPEVDTEYTVWDSGNLNMGETIITDLNSATTRGIYSFNPGVLNGPSVVSGYGTVQVFAPEGSLDKVIQQVTGFNSESLFEGVFVRARLDLNTWSNWNSITMTTESQSGGGN